MFTRQQLDELSQKWLAEGWSAEAVAGTIRGMEYTILAELGESWLEQQDKTLGRD